MSNESKGNLKLFMGIYGIALTAMSLFIILMVLFIVVDNMTMYPYVDMGPLTEGRSGFNPDVVKGGKF